MTSLQGQLLWEHQPTVVSRLRRTAWLVRCYAALCPSRRTVWSSCCWQTPSSKQHTLKLNPTCACTTVQGLQTCHRRHRPSRCLSLLLRSNDRAENVFCDPKHRFAVAQPVAALRCTIIVEVHRQSASPSMPHVLHVMKVCRCVWLAGKTELEVCPC